MVRCIGCPDLFITFSAADIHWDSFFRFFPEYEQWKNAHGAYKFRLASRILYNNPHIAAYHFHARFTAFMEHFLKPKFGVVDH